MIISSLWKRERIVSEMNGLSADYREEKQTSKIDRIPVYVATHLLPPPPLSLSCLHVVM